jgi:hypothetical protein
MYIKIKTHSFPRKPFTAVMYVCTAHKKLAWLHAGGSGEKFEVKSFKPDNEDIICTSNKMQIDAHDSADVAWALFNKRRPACTL